MPTRRRRRHQETSLSTDVILRILDFVFAKPRPEDVNVWPVVNALTVGTTPHVRREDGLFAIRDECQFDSRSRGRLEGYWADRADRAFLCVSPLETTDLASAFSLLYTNRAYWFQRAEYLDDESRRLVCCSVSRDAIRLLASSADASNDDRKHAVDVDTIGIDYPNGKRFVYRPAGSRITRALAARYTHSVRVAHVFADFVYGSRNGVENASTEYGFWVTTNTRADVLTDVTPDEEARYTEQHSSVLCGELDCPPAASPISSSPPHAAHAAAALHYQGDNDDDSRPLDPLTKDAFCPPHLEETLPRLAAVPLPTIHGSANGDDDDYYDYDHHHHHHDPDPPYHNDLLS